MNRIEAIKALYEGKKIRKNSWKTNEYICIKDFEGLQGNNEVLAWGVILDAPYDKWELYEEEIKNFDEIYKKLEKLRGKNFNILKSVLIVRER